MPAGAAVDFPSLELTLCVDLFGVRSTPVLSQWHVKDPGHSAQSAGGGLLHAYTLDPTKSEQAECAAIQALRGSLPGKKLTCNSSQLAESLRTYPGLQNGISMREQVSAKKKKQQQQNSGRGLNGRTFSPNPRKRGKGHHHRTW